MSKTWTKSLLSIVLHKIIKVAPLCPTCGLSDGKNRTLENFLVSCPKGTKILKYVDASNPVKNAPLLRELLESAVLKVRGSLSKL
jgi:hypothetical protein